MRAALYLRPVALLRGARGCAGAEGCAGAHACPGGCGEAGAAFSRLWGAGHGRCCPGGGAGRALRGRRCPGPGGAP